MEHQLDSVGDSQIRLEMERQLFPVSEDNYGPEYKSHLVDIYRLYVEMADRVSGRRQTANSFYLTVNTAIIGGASFLKIPEALAGGLWLIGIAGVALCAMWIRSIQSYRDLNSAKFHIITEVEQRLPVAPYDVEWEILRRGKESAIYRPFHTVEKYVPQIFMVLYVTIILLSIDWPVVSQFEACNVW